MPARKPVSAVHAALDAPPADGLTVLRAVPAVASAVGAELGDFTAERLKAHALRIRAWSKLRSPMEFVDAELRFAVDSMRVYADEMLHLQEIAGAAFRAALPDAAAQGR